jgi:hypothetical protein
MRDAAAILTNCDKHLRIRADDVTALARRGLTLLILGRQPEAEPDLDRARSVCPGIQPLLDLVIRAAQNGGAVDTSGPAAGERRKAQERSWACDR